MSWLNLNESLTNIKGQISNFANGVLADGIVNDTDPFTELSTAQQKIKELQNLCASQDVEILKLRRQNAEFYEKLSFGTQSKHETQMQKNGENWFWDPPEEKPQNNTDLSTKIETLELEKKDLIQNLEQLDLDCQRTVDKLVTLKDDLQTDYNKLKNDFEWLKSENEELTKENCNLKRDIGKYSEISNLSDDFQKLKDISEEKHKKYITILTEMVKKYVDYEIPEDFVQNNESPEICEFTSKVEAVLKLLLDFKWKTETLERKLCEISHEKSVAISEKNHEIEKLLHNSEILSQEVITKTQTIKDYEIECSELIKNNDLLIAELQQYKNNGLQTISETNEDNLLLLETQLEQSNKRVRELELLINDMENSKQDVAIETQTELDYIKKQLNLTGKELSQSKIEYKELSKRYKQLEVDNKNLETLIDKLKGEIENTEYKFTETNVNFETLKEEVQNLSNSNENLISQNKELQTEINSLKSQLDSVVSIKEQIEHQNRNLTEKLQSSKMSETGLKLQNDTIKRELDLATELNTNLDQKIKNYEFEISNAFQELKSSSNSLQDDENVSLTQKINLLANQNTVQALETKINELQCEINNLNISKADLVALVTNKHQENIQYHAEIQRLNQIIAMETEKNQQVVDNTTIEQLTMKVEQLDEQNNFLKDKCEKLTQIISEKQSIIDKEQSLTKELDRLRLHLVQIEDSYTRELLQAEEKNKEMLTKVNEIEQRERDSSTIYTSVSIRANQQVETLQNQLQLVTVQRDELQRKISEAEDKNNKQFAALTNLQCVLEQFQKDRDKDIMAETERIRRQIKIEHQKQSVLQDEINLLKAQLEESKQGLKAAARLTEQVEKSKHQVTEMKNEVSKLQDQLSKTEDKYRKLSTETGAKVDKSLIKNLIVGFISANNNLNKDQSQILKIIATVLDFSQQDNEKLNKNAGSWLSTFLHPVAGSAQISQQSLSEAFVRFLENESQPKRNPPPLINMRKMSTDSNVSSASNSTRTPALSEVVLPTFADFAQNRNSSSILKDVLKEN